MIAWFHMLHCHQMPSGLHVTHILRVGAAKPGPQGPGPLAPAPPPARARAARRRWRDPPDGLPPLPWEKNTKEILSHENWELSHENMEIL